MNGKKVALIILGLAVIGLLIAPAALAYSDAVKGVTEKGRALAVSPTMKVSPTPKKITPTPVMKMQVTLTNTTQTEQDLRSNQTVAPARHSRILGEPKSKVGEPLGIRSHNASTYPSIYQTIVPTPTATPRPR